MKQFGLRQFKDKQFALRQFHGPLAPPADIIPVAGPRVVPQRKRRRDSDDDVLLFILR